jgi:hypothetical protein
VDINDPKVTVNRSMITMDGNIGLFVRSEKTFGGFSLIQFPQGTLIPYKSRARLIPSWQILFGKNFTLSPYIVVNSLIAARLTDKKPDGNLAVNALFSEVVLIGANLNPRKSFSILAGLEGVSVSGMYLTPVFSFSIPFGAFKLATNPYEITLKLQLKKYEQKGLLFSRLNEK